MEEQFCSEHDKVVKEHRCMKEKVDDLRNEKRFWHRLLGSKWSYIIIPAFFLLIFGWMGRVERVIQGKEVDKVQIITLCKDIQEIKVDNKARDEKREVEKKEEEKRREEDSKEQLKKDREIMKILLDIQKQIRK